MKICCYIVLRIYIYFDNRPVLLFDQGREERRGKIIQDLSKAILKSKFMIYTSIVRWISQNKFGIGKISLKQEFTLNAQDVECQPFTYFPWFIIFWRLDYYY